MANTPYNKWLQSQVTGAAVNWTSDTIKVAVLSGSYVFSQAHQFLSDLAGILVTGTLSSKTATDGILDAIDTIVAQPASAPAAVVIYKDTGVAGTSPLMLFFDTGVGFGNNPGGVLTIQWPNTPGKIFAIGGL